MTKTVRVFADFSEDEMAAVDAWIDRAPEPKPSRAEAIREIVNGRLAASRPATILPNEVTGRDIFR